MKTKQKLLQLYWKEVERLKIYQKIMTGFAVWLDIRDQNSRVNQVYGFDAQWTLGPLTKEKAHKREHQKQMG